jgi:hypothetical protein
MAKKKATSRTSSAPKKRRHRRSPDEIIADLQDEIRRVRARQTARELKRSPSHKAALSVVKAIDKALNLAAEEGETALRHALADARKATGTYLEEKGVRLGKANLPKGPRPRAGS